MMKEKENKTHSLQLLIRAVVTDPDGKVISDTGQKPSKSFVLQFLEGIYTVFRLTGSVAITSIAGTELQFYVSTFVCSRTLIINGPVNNSAYGIVVGTGDTAETNTDYKLETQLTEGLTAGKITHGATIIGTTAVVGANVDMEIKRAFSNNTGSVITVKEAGIYFRYYIYYSFCAARDVLSVPVEVPDKCSLTMYYTLRTTV